VDLLVFTCSNFPLKYLFVLWKPPGKKISNKLYLACNFYLQYNLYDSIIMYLPVARNRPHRSIPYTFSLYSFDSLHLFRNLSIILIFFLDKYRPAYDVGSPFYRFPHRNSDGPPFNSISASDDFHRGLHCYAYYFLTFYNI
jgi:hypothetical protein